MRAAPFQELERVLAILDELALPHALIGGWAVIAWGFLRASEDLDARKAAFAKLIEAERDVASFAPICTEQIV